MKKFAKIYLFFLICSILFYSISYAACPFVEDDFDDGILNSKWTAEARDGAIIEQGGQVEITAGRGDIWNASFTPIAAGKPNPIVPRPPEFIQRRGLSNR